MQALLPVLRDGRCLLCPRLYHPQAIYFHNSGRLRACATASAYPDCDGRDVYVVSGKDVAYDLRAERHLVVGCGIAKQNRRVVEDAFGKNMARAVKYADFG